MHYHTTVGAASEAVPMSCCSCSAGRGHRKEFAPVATAFADVEASRRCATEQQHHRQPPRRHFSLITSLSDAGRDAGGAAEQGQYCSTEVSGLISIILHIKKLAAPANAALQSKNNVEQRCLLRF